MASKDWDRLATAGARHRSATFLLMPLICSRFSTDDWNMLSKQLDEDGCWSEHWLKAIDVFERRMEERYFRCIDALIAADTSPDKSLGASTSERHCTPGFSIMAICCLLIEALQSFREDTPQSMPPSGPCSFPSSVCIKPPSGTNQRFRNFLKLPSFAGAFSEPKIAKAFAEGIRNGILHDAETRKWVIWREQPTGIIVQKLDNKRYALNRTLFYESLKQEFKSYLCELHDPDKKTLRVRFREKMTRISEQA
jgi:hypothetical protein